MANDSVISDVEAELNVQVKVEPKFEPSPGSGAEVNGASVRIHPLQVAAVL